MGSKYNWLILVLCAVLLGCRSTGMHETHASNVGGIYAETNPGYSLLYKLMSDESNVGKIFFLKKADTSIEKTVKEIGTACGAAKERLDQLAKEDHRLEFEVPGLPYMEQRSRDLQAKTDEHALLFSSGKPFELRLLFTQAQAMNYGTQLCRALAEKEPDLRRKAFLQTLEQQCIAFHDRLMKMMAVSAS